MADFGADEDVGGAGMTITRYDGFAAIPKRCSVCGRLFWLEPYDVFYKTVGIESYSLKQIRCVECEKGAQE